MLVVLAILYWNSVHIWIVYMDVFTGSYNVVPTLHTLRITELSDPWTVYINVFTGIYGI